LVGEPDRRGAVRGATARTEGLFALSRGGIRVVVAEAIG
jgi:hypothetical protein